jgi:glyoxylase-like metal-dependent hydrolase (beta-lactamase superfamily II)
MNIHIIETGNFMCDGGSMFSVVPKFMWEKKYPCNEDNLCNCAIRSILIEDGDRKILVDTGIGNKLDKNGVNSNHLNGEDSLENSLAKAGIKEEDITDVLFTHLHFDHAGGAVSRDANNKLELVFKNATHWVSRAQFDSHQNPNIREADSFRDEDISPILKEGKLSYIEDRQKLTENVEIRLFYGHTTGLALPFIKYGDKNIVFAGDFIPSSANVNIKWLASYDIEPLKALKEKELFYAEAINKNYYLIFQHDLYTQACSLKQTERGIKIDKAFNLNEIL